MSPKSGLQNNAVPHYATSQNETCRDILKRSETRHPDLVDAENEALALTRAQLASRVSSARERVSQRVLEVTEL